MKQTPAVVQADAKSESNAVNAVFYHVIFALAILIVAAVLAAQVFAKPAPQDKAGSGRKQVQQPVELGDVQWLRDLDTAVSNSKKESKPIAILFQEVPG